MNRTYTAKDYDYAGNCTRCYTEHRSTHGHSYSLEYLFNPVTNRLTMYLNGKATLLTNEAAKRWRISQSANRR